MNGSAVNVCISYEPFSAGQSCSVLLLDPRQIVVDSILAPVALHGGPTAYQRPSTEKCSLKAVAQPLIAHYEQKKRIPATSPASRHSQLLVNTTTFYTGTSITSLLAERSAPESAQTGVYSPCGDVSFPEARISPARSEMRRLPPVCSVSAEPIGGLGGFQTVRFIGPIR